MFKGVVAKWFKCVLLEFGGCLAGVSSNPTKGPSSLLQHVPLPVLLSTGWVTGTNEIERD